MDLTLLTSSYIQIYIYLVAKETVMQIHGESSGINRYKLLQAKFGSKCNKDVSDVIHKGWKAGSNASNTATSRNTVRCVLNTEKISSALLLRDLHTNFSLIERYRTLFPEAAKREQYCRLLTGLCVPIVK